MSYTRGESLGPCRVGEPCPAPLRVAMRSPLPFPCVPDRPYKILLAQVGTLSFSHPCLVCLFYLFRAPCLGSCLPGATPGTCRGARRRLVVLALRHRCYRQRARWGLPCDCLGAPPACFCHHAVVPLRSRRATAASAAEGGPRLRESRLAAFAGCPPLGLIAGAATGPCRGRPRSSRSCEPGCVHCAAPARRDRRPPDSVLRGLRRRVGGRALGGDRHLSALLCFSLVRPWKLC